MTAMADEIHQVPHPLTLNTTAIPFDSGDFDADYIVGGIEWLSYASEQYPYQRQLQKVLKDQLDTSDQPGDQSLDAWWTRSKTDWSAGAGVEFMEPTNDEFVMRSYWDSHNVDVFTHPGDVSLLPAEAVVHTETSAVAPTLVKMTGNNYAVSHDDKVYLSSTMMSVTVGGLVRSMILAGGHLLVATDANTIEVLATDGTLVSTIDHALVAGVPMMRWVKGRVILGVADKLFELVDLSADVTLVDAVTGTRDQTMPIVNMRDTTWQFSGACGTPKSILVSGYGASGSTIQALTLDDKGALPDISAPVEVAQFPVNEVVTDIASYLGTYVGIGTDKGFRVATVSDGGGLVYGPLLNSPVPTQRVGTFSVFDRFMHYVAGDDFIKVDLSSSDEQGRYAWSKFTSTPGATTGAILGSRESLMVSWNGSTVMVHHFTDANGPASSGWLESAKVRFGTLQRKYFDEVRINLADPTDGSVKVTANGDDLGSAVSDTTVLKFGTASAAVAMKLRFDFTPGSGAGPVLQAWSMRAMPAIEDRGQQVILPCLNFDFESDSRGVRAGYEGRAWERWEAATRLYTRGTAVLVHETKTECQYQAVVEDMTFTQIAPPTNASGFGGVCQLVLRTV